jgi:hypothetical protein
MPDRLGQAGRHVSRQDPQVIGVVQLEHLGYQPRAHRVGLAAVPVDSNPHRPAFLTRLRRPVLRTPDLPE